MWNANYSKCLQTALRLILTLIIIVNRFRAKVEFDLKVEKCRIKFISHVLPMAGVLFETVVTIVE